MQEWYRAYIDKLDRRIERITQNADPAKPSANKLGYQLEKEHCLEILDAWDNGRPIAYSPCGMNRLFKTMGLEYCHPGQTADIMLVPYAGYLVERVRALGYPDRSCDRTVICIPAALEGQLPPPGLCVGTNVNCDELCQTMASLAREFKAPYFHIDVPPEQNEHEMVYVANQYRELIRYIEENVPGAKKYDEKELVRRQALDRELHKYGEESLRARMSVPAILPNRESFRLFGGGGDRSPNNPELLLANAKMRRDESVARVEKKFSGVPGERLRFMIAVSFPFFSDILEYMQAKGVAFPVLYNGGIPSGCGVAPSMWEVGPYGRDLKDLHPLEIEAKRMQMISWAGFGDRWARDGVGLCKDFKIDGVVYMMQSGCVTTLGTGRLFAEYVEKELGIPTLFIDGRMMIPEGHDEQKWHDQLDDFIDLVLARKAKGAVA